jgi:LysR family transcriptional regulator, glycine cleavage system transcriptional activator
MSDRSLPPLNWLRAFEASARTLSFTDAARELHLTQAAVSKHVKSLEFHLRHQLFHRRAHSLELTMTGEAYLPKVQDAFDRLDVGTREVFGRRKTEALTVRCAVSFAVKWLAPRLPDFYRRFPNVQLRILSSVWSDAFDAQTFDLDIQYGAGTWAGLRSHRLTHESITPLCSPALAALLVRAEDLKTTRLLHVLGYQEGWGVWLNAAGATDVDPGQGLQLDTSLTAFELAAQGAGVALGRSSLSKADLLSGRVVAPFALDVPIKESFYLLEATGSAAHPDARLFSEWIIETAGRRNEM